MCLCAAVRMCACAHEHPRMCESSYQPGFSFLSTCQSTSLAHPNPALCLVPPPAPPNALGSPIPLACVPPGIYLLACLALPHPAQPTQLLQPFHWSIPHPVPQHTQAQAAGPSSLSPKRRAHTWATCLCLCHHKRAHSLACSFAIKEARPHLGHLPLPLYMHPGSCTSSFATIEAHSHLGFSPLPLHMQTHLGLLLWHHRSVHTPWLLNFTTTHPHAPWPSPLVSKDLQ